MRKRLGKLSPIGKTQVTKVESKTIDKMKEDARSSKKRK